MDVPEITLKLLNRDWSLPMVATEMFSGHEARINDPGAIISGFITNGQLSDGPLEETSSQ